MGDLQKLPNIGKELEKQLNAVGVTTCEELKEQGTRQVWLKIQEIDDTACIHRLMALEGAIQGVRKSALPQETKNELKEFYNWNKK